MAAPAVTIIRDFPLNVSPLSTKDALFECQKIEQILKKLEVFAPYNEELSQTKFNSYITVSDQIRIKPDQIAPFTEKFQKYLMLYIEIQEITAKVNKLYFCLSSQKDAQVIDRMGHINERMKYQNRAQNALKPLFGRGITINYVPEKNPLYIRLFKKAVATSLSLSKIFYKNNSLKAHFSAAVIVLTNHILPFKVPTMTCLIGNYTFWASLHFLTSRGWA